MMEAESTLQQNWWRRDAPLSAGLAIGTALVLLVSLKGDKVPAFMGWLLAVPVLLALLAIAKSVPLGKRPLLRAALERLRSIDAIWPVAAAALTVSFTVAQIANNMGGRPDSFWPVFWLWIVAVGGTLAVAIAPGIAHLASRVQLRQWATTYKWDLVAITGLTGAALVPRLVNLAGEPWPFSGDEAAMGEQAIAVMQGTVRNMFMSGLQGHPTMFFFELAGFFKLFGVSVVSQRLWAVMFGTAAIPMLYILLRSWFGRTVALLGAGYLVAYHFDVQFSRIAMNNIGDPILLTASVYFGWRASRTLAPKDFALAGIVLGLSLYSYVGARITPLIVGAILAYAAVSRPRTIPQMAKGGVLMAMGYGIAALPLGVFWMTHQDQFMDRLNSTGIFQSGWLEAHQKITGQSTTAILWDQVVHSFGAFGYYKDLSPHYFAPISFVDRLSLLPFLIGIGVSVVRIRDVRYLALIVMFIGSIASGSVLTESPPTSPRLLGAIPSVSAWVALGLAQMAVWLAFGRKRPALVLASVGLAILVSYNFYFYFGQYRTGGYYSDYNTRVGVQVADYVETLPTDTRVFFYGADRMFMSSSGHPAMTFPIWDWARFDVLKDGRLTPPDVPEGKAPAVFIFLPHRESEMTPLMQSCPGGEQKTFTTPAERAGTSGPQTEQTSFLAYQVLTPNTCVPATTPPTPTPTVQAVQATALPGAEERNAQRIQDLTVLNQLLQQFFARGNSYPSTGGGLQTLCAVEPVDAGCKLKDSGVTLPADPLGSPLTNGYWYISDGNTFTLVAVWEGATPPPADFSCPATLTSVAEHSSLLCLQGKR